MSKQCILSFKSNAIQKISRAAAKHSSVQSLEICHGFPPAFGSVLVQYVTILNFPVYSVTSPSPPPHSLLSWLLPYSSIWSAIYNNAQRRHVNSSASPFDSQSQPAMAIQLFPDHGPDRLRISRLSFRNEQNRGGWLGQVS